MNLDNQKQNSLPLVLRKRIGWAPEGLHTAAMLLCRIQAQPLQLQSVLAALEKKTGNVEAISQYLPLSFYWLLMQHSIAEGLESNRSNNRIMHSNLLRQSVIKVNLFFQHNLRFNRYNTYSTAATQRAISARVYFTKNAGRDVREGAGNVTQQSVVTKEIKYLNRQVVFHEHVQDMNLQPFKTIIMPIVKQNVRDFRAEAEKDSPMLIVTKEIKYLNRQAVFHGHVQDMKLQPLKTIFMPIVKQNVRDFRTEAEKDSQKPVIAKGITYTERVFRSSPTLREQASDVSAPKAHSESVTPHSGNAVERLFEMSIASKPIQGFKLHDISGNEAAIANTIEKKIANSVSTFMSNPAIQNKHEINQLADKVSRILQQRERFERERKGQF